MNGRGLLLDTHAFLWWKTGDFRLSANAKRSIEESSTNAYLSAVSCWEIAIKFHNGKLPIQARLALNVEAGALESGLIPLAISFDHCQSSAQLPKHHKDPFDRLLIAQALTESMVLVSADTLFDEYGVPRLW